MKKLVLLLLVLIPFSIHAQSLSGYHTVKEKTKSFFKSTPSETALQGEVCLDDGTGTLRKTNRSPYEIAFRLNLLDTPNGGTMQFKGTENMDLVVRHNLSNTFYAQAAYGNRNIEKTDWEGDSAVYDSKWETRQLFGGFGVYVTPKLSVTGSVGRIWAQDSEGTEASLGMAVEYSLAWDLPLYGNTLRLEYRAVNAPQDEGATIEESTADGGYSALSISFVISL